MLLRHELLVQEVVRQDLGDLEHPVVGLDLQVHIARFQA